MDILNILTVVMIVLVIEAAIYGICCILCREKHDRAETGTRSKLPSHHSGLHPHRMTHVVDPQKAWPPPNEQQSKETQNNARLMCFAPRISSFRDCD